MPLQDRNYTRKVLLDIALASCETEIKLRETPAIGEIMNVKQNTAWIPNTNHLGGNKIVMSALDINCEKLYRYVVQSIFPV